MNGLYDIFNSFFNSLAEIKNGLEPIANRSGLTSDEALLLIIINVYSEIDIKTNGNLINQLCERGLTEYTEKRISVTSRGAILAKSLELALKKL